MVARGKELSDRYCFERGYHSLCPTARARTVADAVTGVLGKFEHKAKQIGRRRNRQRIARGRARRYEHVTVERADLTVVVIRNSPWPRR